MKEYLVRLVKEQIRRGELLKGLIICPPEVRELNSLAEKCIIEIDMRLKELAELNLMLEGDLDNQVIRYIYRRYHDNQREIDLIERYGISILKMQCEDFGYLNRLISKIQTETKIPLTIASVASISTDFFFYAPKTHVIFIPAAEHLFLQQLPSLYHELGHYVCRKSKETKLKQLYQSFEACIQEITRYYGEIIKQRLLETNADKMVAIAWAIQSKWKSKWFEELFCDGFATFLVGPAYSWSWIHIVTKINDDVYFFNHEIYRTHPAHEARFRFTLHCLKRLGFKEEVDRLLEIWNSLLLVDGKKGSAFYYEAYPDDLLEALADLIMDGMKKNGFVLYTKDSVNNLPTNHIGKTLNDAWEVFWKSPDTFYDYEEKRIEELKKSL